MRTAILLLIASLMILSACNKDEFQYSFETPSKLLVSIIENDQLIEEFKYDNSDRLIQADRYLPGDPVCISQFFEYNSDNLIIKKTYGEYIETYEYNNNGRLMATILHFKSVGDGYEWAQKTEFQYSNGRISKGIKYSHEGLESGYIEYKYDSRGNTTERTEYSVLPDYHGMIISQYKYSYDEKINPHYFSGTPFWTVHQVDIVQGNNPTYSYYYNISMSAFPPEYEFTYEYDQTGLPIKGTMKHLRINGSTAVFEYKYIDRNN